MYFPLGIWAPIFRGELAVESPTFLLSLGCSPSGHPHLVGPLVTFPEICQRCCWERVLWVDKQLSMYHRVCKQLYIYIYMLYTYIYIYSSSLRCRQSHNHTCFQMGLHEIRSTQPLAVGEALKMNTKSDRRPGGCRGGGGLSMGQNPKWTHLCPP